MLASLSTTGKNLSSRPLVMYYDSTVEYFSEDQLPFAVVSICVGLVFLMFPTCLLMLYPTRIRKCITCCRFRRWHEAFQGQYKDGTTGTWDFRIVSWCLLTPAMMTVLIMHMVG